jgi:DNA-binding NarL/FixJ family response regulator
MGFEALRLCRQLAPEVAVVDARLAGVEVVRIMWEVSPTTEVVVLTMYDDEFTVAAMLKAGARSYLLKESAASELARAIRGATRGQSVLDPAITSTRIAIFKESVRAPAGTAREELAPREREIADALALSPQDNRQLSGHHSAEAERPQQG